MKRLLPFLALALSLLWLASTLAPRKPDSAFDLDGFGRLPVLVGGRIKPMDTVARTSLLMLQGRQRVTSPDGTTLPPVAWLLDVLYKTELADTYQHFEIVHPDVLALFQLKPEDGAGKKRYSYNQLEKGLPELDRQHRLAGQVDAGARTAFQKAVVNLADHVTLYFRLKHSVVSPERPDFLSDITLFQDTMPAGIAAVRAKQAGQPYDEKAFKTLIESAQRFEAMGEIGYLLPIPPATATTDRTAWKATGHALLETFDRGSVHPAVLAYAGLGHAWTRGQPEQFNTLIGLYRDQLAKEFQPELGKTGIETRFNAAQPFYTSMVLYVAAFLLAAFSWLRWPVTLQRSSFHLLLLAWLATTAGIALRMWLEGRPPVTNLYSSALFVGWGSVGLCLILERVYKNGVGAVSGGLIGFCALLIAHHLSLSGDTLEMMRAVLDSNFWLATHVIIITIGYSATFLAGFLALVYVLRGVFTRSLDRGTADALNRMVYGIVCFATLFSLVGTILGGIWADQSWGRFWGWDPKENGALMIVIWNAIYLHARWGGLVRVRGLMALALGGNIITSWSWFGTNMLGVGLHSYGFMDAAFWWLLAFVFSQLVLIGLTAVPAPKWRSAAALVR